MRLFPIIVLVFACGEKIPAVADSGSTAETPTTSTSSTTASTTSTTSSSTTTTTTTTTTGSGTGTITSGTGTGATGTGGTTPPGTRTGTYVGTVNITIEEIGFVVNTDSCVANLTVNIDELLFPQITSLPASCTMTGALAGRVVEISLQGDILNPSASGDVNIRVGTVTPTDNWAGTFTTLNTLDGAFAGAEMLPGGTAGTTWDATFTATR